MCTNTERVCVDMCQYLHVCIVLCTNMYCMRVYVYVRTCVRVCAPNRNLIKPLDGTIYLCTRAEVYVCGHTQQSGC